MMVIASLGDARIKLWQQITNSDHAIIIIAPKAAIRCDPPPMQESRESGLGRAFQLSWVMRKEAAGAYKINN